MEVTSVGEIEGLERLPDAHWAFYSEVLRLVREQGEPFVVGGAFAYAAYTGVYRGTKDIDLYILPDSRHKLISALQTIGVVDYYAQEPYDGRWLYRGVRDGLLVDLIWDMANYRAKPDEEWFTHGKEIAIHGETMKVLPAEELMWNKLYIINRKRSDWTDVWNVLYYAGETLNWDRFIKRIGDDIYLLSGALCAFIWLCPGRAQRFPADLWAKVGLQPPNNAGAPDFDRLRVELLDSRPWFLPALGKGEEPVW